MDGITSQKLRFYGRRNGSLSVLDPSAVIDDKKRLSP